MTGLNQTAGDGVVDEMNTETEISMTEGMTKSSADHQDFGEEEALHQTDSENNKDPAGTSRPSEEAASQVDFQNRSDTELENKPGSNPDTADMTPENIKTRASVRPTSEVLSIDDHLAVQTQEEKAKNDFLDLLESHKTGRILTGTIQGIERPEPAGEARAVIYHGDIKVLIPAAQVVEPPEDFRGRLPEDVMHYMVTKRLGAEVDYIVKGLDPDANIAVASRLDAMRAKRKEYYFGQDRDGNNILHSGICAEARVVSVIRAGIFVDLFGQEVYIPLRELSYQRMMDAAGFYQPGQRIIVKILSVERSDRNNIKVSASVKQAGENPYERALKKYSVGNRYVGTVSMVDTNGVFVSLDGGIDCLCSYPKRGRPPRGARVTVRILGMNTETNRIWGAITHIAAAH